MGLGAQGRGLPERIGGYALERELGAGGMGTVYLARSRGGRTVAVKVARPELAADPHFRARFRAEVEAARRVGGFHTAPVVDADPDAETPWLATAYIPGPTLSRLLVERGPMDEGRLRMLGAALAEALQAIHACGLIHRDLKPGNIIMADDGPRVLDFGIARALESTRLTSTGAAFGTPGFLAPEQAQGLEVGAAADVFALGAVLVAASGGSAFGEGTPMALMYRSVHEEANLSAVPEDLRPVVAACLAKQPERRPTPSRLLDLFVPEPEPEAMTEPEVVSAPGPESVPVSVAVPEAEPVPVPDPTPVPAEPPAAAATHPPTFSVPADAVPPPGSPGTPERTVADGPVGPDRPVGPGVESAVTRTGVVPVPGPRGPAPGPVAGRRRRPGVVAVVVAGVLLVGGAVGYALYESPPEGTGSSLPRATHMLVMPASMLGGTYNLTSETLPPADRTGDAPEEDVRHLSAGYYGDDGAAFRGVEAVGVFGRLKDPEARREAYLTVATGDKVIEPRREFRLPGSDVEFSCDMVTVSGTYTTRCAWADGNTAARVLFSPATVDLDLAAKETRRIHQAMRTPII
ncbi:protein kinase domain-containing protein [Streptomyces hydrogenans]|uniref:serine/threonine-protein kinase n=1 Tax=Streptomyces hydrogenans TaxID=1873719 RepID=UPI003F57B7AB